jgi:hypothetical protein
MGSEYLFRFELRANLNRYPDPIFLQEFGFFGGRRFFEER